MINMRTDGVGGNLRIQYLTRLLVTLRIKSSLVTLVLKVLRDGCEGGSGALKSWAGGDLLPSCTSLRGLVS